MSLRLFRTPPGTIGKIFSRMIAGQGSERVKHHHRHTQKVGSRRRRRVTDSS